eukprot:1611413-Prymnesium_polylepis.1
MRTRTPKHGRGASDRPVLSCRATDPAEWRNYCLATHGSPITACSYFQYEESPGFMTFFYTVYISSLIVLTAAQAAALGA